MTDQKTFTCIAYERLNNRACLFCGADADGYGYHAVCACKACTERISVPELDRIKRRVQPRNLKTHMLLPIRINQLAKEIRSYGR